LGAAARHRVQPRLLEAGERLPRLDLPAPPEVVDLGRGEPLDLGLRTGLMDGLDQPLEVLERPVRMVPAHDVGLARARLDHGQHVLDGVLERALLALLPGEVTKAAREHTYVRRIDVAVEHEEDPVSVEAGLGEVRHAADRVQIVRLEEDESLRTGEALPSLNLLPDAGKTGIADTGRRGYG